MAYHFVAERSGDHDLQILHQRLTRCELIESFPVEISGDALTLAISIPFKGMDDARFESELTSLMTYLVVEQGFRVTDLYTGAPVTADAIPGLARQISA